MSGGDSSSLRRTKLNACDRFDCFEASVASQLNRIASLDPAINSFIEVRGDDALSAARLADLRCANGEARLPIDGMSVAVKDMFSLEGRRATFGSAQGQQSFPAHSAPILQRLGGAGAINLGFLNMSEFALGPTGHNKTFGHCHNPWDLARVSGGSSSGASAALAAQFIDGAIGSDTGGSIRIPASCCGVVGLKPTAGQVSTEGTMPLSWTLDCVGPLARTALECARIFEVISNAPTERCNESPRTRLLYPRNTIDAGTCGEVMEHLDRAMAVLVELGFAAVYEVPMPNIRELHDLAATVQAFESCIVHADNLRERRHLYTPHVLSRILPGLDISSETYILALDQRPRRLWDFLTTTLVAGRVLVLPTLGCLVPTIAETDQEQLGALPNLVGNMTQWTRWLNYLGLPALSLPCGVDRNGLPVGMQLVGPPMTERQLLSIAATYQEATGLLSPAGLRS
jgi:aspartyl-tRNA(Asn)/glutamyl-tRNA(Gln) amidotransferase subunit A